MYPKYAFGSSNFNLLSKSNSYSSMFFACTVFPIYMHRLRNSRNARSFTEINTTDDAATIHTSMRTMTGNSIGGYKKMLCREIGNSSICLVMNVMK